MIMTDDSPGEFRLDEHGVLLFKPRHNWSHTIEDLAERVARIIGHDRTFQPFQKNKDDDSSWVLDSGNNWWFHTNPKAGEGWFDITYRYFHDCHRSRLEALGAALVWLV